MLKSKKLRIAIVLASIGAVTSVAFTNCSELGFQALASMGDDPYVGLAWHLGNNGQKVYAAKAATSGKDMNVLGTWAEGIFGEGIVIQISDTGFEDTHEDLHANFLYGASKNYALSAPYVANSGPPLRDGDTHGTSVAGLAAAVGGNGLGSRGVAPKASLVSANVISSGVTHTDYSKYIDQLKGTFDISNMSWGASQYYVDDNSDGAATNWENNLLNAVKTQRNGKGTIYVKAAGNDFIVECGGTQYTSCVGNSNFDRDDATPYTINVAALDADGNSASYSSPGANLWISSFGGEDGANYPAMMTTDRMGCSLGESQSNISTTVKFEKGQSGNSNCNYTVTFNGTSSAAPTVSGAVALMLQVNPNLSWRDVKYILAATARTKTSTDPIKHPLIPSQMAPGLVWEQGWVTNAAGFKFHNWYGFGAINVDAAVKMAKTYSSALGTYHETGWYSSGTVNLAIPDYNATGVSSTINVASDNVKIEGVKIKAVVSHAKMSQLEFMLTSPNGTKSIIINAGNSLTGMTSFTGGEVFLSNAFLGEYSASGNWTLTVIDAQSGTTGTLTSWGISFVGGH